MTLASNFKCPGVREYVLSYGLRRYGGNVDVVRCRLLTWCGVGCLLLWVQIACWLSL